MIEVEILHDLALVRPVPRTGRPRIRICELRTAVAIREAAPGFLRPLDQGLDAGISACGRDSRKTGHLRRTDDAVWTCIWVHDPNHLRGDPPPIDRERDPAVDDLLREAARIGLHLAEDILADGMPPFPNRPATLAESLSALRGASLGGDGHGLLRLTPVRAIGLTGKDVALDAVPTGAEADGARAALISWAEGSLVAAEGTLWFRIGPPALAVWYDRLEISHPAGISLDDPACFAAPSLDQACASAPLGCLDALMAYLRRIGWKPSDERSHAGRELIARKTERVGGSGFAGERETDTFFANHACAFAFSEMIQAPSGKTSAEAEELRDPLAAALARLAPFAALGATKAIADGEAADALSAMAHAVRLFERCHPYWKRFRYVVSLAAYAEAEAIPRLLRSGSDGADLAALADGADPAPEPDAPAPPPVDEAPFSFDPAHVTGCTVATAGDRPLGKVESLAMGLDGRIASIRVRSAGRTFHVPFGEVRLERSDDAVDEIVVMVDQVAFERRLLAAS